MKDGQGSATGKKRSGWRTALAGQKGQMLLLGGLMMPAMLSVVGLVLDGGFIYAESRRAQSAADASALAGAAYVWKNTATDCDVTGDPCGIKDYAGVMGYSSTNSTITITHPAESSGTYSATEYASAGDYLKVNIRYEVPKFFIGIVFPAAAEVSVTSIAGVARVPSEYAVATTADPCTSPDVGLSGSVDLIVNNGAIMSNCTSATSIQVTGSSTLQADAIQTAGSCSPVSLPCETGMAQIADPMGTLPNPCTSASTSSPNPYPCPVRDWAETGVADSDSVVLNPGIWDSITPSGSATVWLRTGVYVIKSSVNSTGSTGFKVCTGSGPAGGAPPGDKGKTADGYGCTGGTGGVLLFIANNEYDPARANPCDNGSAPSPTGASLSLGGSAGFNVEAMTSGPYAGLAVWQGCGNTSSISLSGSAGSQVAGTTYAPSATISLSGNANWSTPSSVVAAQVSASGSASITISYDRNVAYKAWNVVLIQ